jgi:hypothetical protein
MYFATIIVNYERIKLDRMKSTAIASIDFSRACSALCLNAPAIHFLED